MVYTLSCASKTCGTTYSIALLGLSIMFGGMYFFMFKSDKEKVERDGNNNNNRRGNNNNHNNNNRDGLRRRNNRGGGEDEDENPLEGLDPNSKKYKKIAAKLEKKAARAARQEQDRQMQEDKRSKMSKRDLEYQKKEEEREAKEREEAEERMKLRAEASLEVGKPARAQVMVSHPNFSGMQMDQVTRLYVPARFVKEIEIFNSEERLITAKLDFAISENPNIRFFFTPNGKDQLRARVLDSENATFEKVLAIQN